MRLTVEENTLLEQRAEAAGLRVAVYARKMALETREPGMDFRTQELLRIMAEIVQQNVLIQKGAVNQEMIEQFEREAARRAEVVLGRRLRLLERMAEETKGAAA